MAADLDLVNRDHNSINDHLKVSFEDVLAEPEGAHSMDCVWSNSYRCFTCWRDVCYTIHTLLCGVCLAMEWGCQFAYIAFSHIWCITPFFKVLELNCGCLQKVYGMCVHCCLDPCCEACGLLFGAFRKERS
ncbi:caveolin-1-like [Babylonia areolata]|uniref:caveolin-1-like n=1 Tax=Babylonia areolata TaxID=304850 RepID=UPI003FD50256